MPRRDREGFQGDRGDEDDEIEYGIRRSRRATSFQYRDSSSLAPAQIIEQEVYYGAAKDALERGVFISHLIVLLLNSDALALHSKAPVFRLRLFGYSPLLWPAKSTHH